MRKVVFITALALVGVPGAALAAKPSTPPANAHGNNPNAKGANANTNGQSAKVLFVLHGTLGAYTAASSTNGSIAITVTRSNHESSLLKGSTQPLTFIVSSTTKVEGTVTSGDKGIVKVRAPKNSSVASLETLTAVQVIDQGASS